MPLDSIRLADLAPAVDGRLEGDDGVLISDVQHDSRAVGNGDLFVAVTGFSQDGHDFAPRAAAAGAGAVCLEHPVDGVDCPRLFVEDTRRALPVLAATVHGHPSRRLAVAGITGTNGKTTVSYFIEAVTAAAGGVPGLVGTLGGRIRGRDVPIPRTTPEASDLQRLLAQMVAAGVDVVALEVSSHALVLHRADAIEFDVVAFTNLSQDHLDFHGDMESYFAAKAELFTRGHYGAAVVWQDDPWGARLADEHLGGGATTVGWDKGADVYPREVRLGLSGASCELVTPSGRCDLTVRLPGRFNLANALVAAACCLHLGFDVTAIRRGIERVATVPGRFESIHSAGHTPGSGPEVIVDYAHTPAGVAAVVAATRELTRGRIVVVLGAGGDRDRSKRPLMGAAAAAADVVVVTSDNPRREEPGSIVAAVAAGARDAGCASVLVEVDRRAAIASALESAGPEDVVLILGKGHEQGQDLGDRVVPFDDRAVARDVLEAS